jgi:8-oxo-dGTP pyrophosphatase MutT (NUDIX family)
MSARKRSARVRLPIRSQVSAGGVVFRREAGGVEVAIIRPRGTERWQLPKGLVDPGEPPEEAARREVREEAGVDSDVVAPIETIDYWYVGVDRDGERVRFHKTVHFFLLAFRSGDVTNHDHEVAEARWIAIDAAVERLAFRNERQVVEKGREVIAGGG